MTGTNANCSCRFRTSLSRLKWLANLGRTLTAIYVLDGEAITLYCDRLQHHVLSKAGDLVHIPAGLPHLPVNLSGKPISAVITRTDLSEQESVVLLPELEAIAEEKIAALKSAKRRPVQ